MKKYIICLAAVITLILSANILNAQGDNDNSGGVFSAFSESNLLQDIGFVFDFAYVWRNLDDHESGQLSVPGAIDINDTESDVLGFNLNYGEMVIPARINNMFRFFIDMHIDTEDFSMHELYVTASDLPAGFNLKFGRFLSHFGRVNSQHAHFQSFYDRPIILQAIYGNEGLIENGLGITWSVPVEFDFVLGAEVLQGENQSSYGNEAIEDENIEAAKLPNIINLLVKGGVSTDAFDIEWGLSGGFGNARIDKNSTATTGWIFEGSTLIIGFDVLVKYNFDSFHYILFQSEFIYRTMNGTKYALGVEYPGVEKTTSGFYAQVLGRIFTHWQFGLRYEMLLKNEETKSDITGTTFSMMDTFKGSFITDFIPTQSTRFRIQYNYNSYQYDGANTLIVNHEVMLQATTSIGKHGKFY